MTREVVQRLEMLARQINEIGLRIEQLDLDVML